MAALRIPACLAVLVVLATAGCRTDPPIGYTHDFTVELDGSGSVAISGEPWMWAAFKKIGVPSNPGDTVDETTIRAAFDRAGLRVNAVDVATRNGRRILTASVGFGSPNALTGSAFPDLVVQSSMEGRRLRVFGVWRRPAGAAIPPGADAPEAGVAIRFAVKGRVYDVRGDAATGGGTILWTRSFSRAAAGDAIDFGVTLGTERSGPDWFRSALAVLAAAFVVLAAILWVVGRRSGRTRGRGRDAGSDSSESDFSKYDPTSPS